MERAKCVEVHESLSLNWFDCPEGQTDPGCPGYWIILGSKLSSVFFNSQTPSVFEIYTLQWYTKIVFFF